MSTPRDRSLSIPSTSHSRTPSNSSPSTMPFVPPSSHRRQPSSSGLSTLPPSLQQQLDPQPNRHRHPFRSHARSISGQFRGDFDGWANLDCLVPSKEDQLQPRGAGALEDESSDEDDDDEFLSPTTRRRKSKDKDRGSEEKERSRSRLRGATFVIRSGRSGSASGGGGMGHSRSASQPFLGSAAMAAIQGMAGSSSVGGLDGRGGGERFLGLGPNQGQQRGRSKSPAGVPSGMTGLGHARKGSSSGVGGSIPGVMGNYHNARHVAGEEFVTGRCMTCASLMRWPREHTVFRCTICMTVNDLVPVERGPSGDGQQQHRDRDRPISLTHARALVEQCLRGFLRERLGDMTAGKAPEDQTEDGDGDGKHKEEEEDRGRRQEPVGAPRPPIVDKEVLPKLVLPPVPQRVAPPVPGQSLLRPPEMRGPRHRRGPSWSGTARSSRAELSPGPAPSPRRQPSRDLLVQKPPSPPPPMPSRPPPSPPTRDAEVKRIFKPLEDYIISCITNFTCLNTSFLNIPLPLPQHKPQPESSQHHKHHPDPLVTRKSPHLDWSRLEQFYLIILEPARPWFDVYRALVQEDPSLAVPAAVLKDIERQLLAAQEHVQRAVLKACEAVLKRPGRRIRSPGEVRWLLVLAACPLFVAGWRSWRGRFVAADGNTGPASPPGTGTGTGPAAGANSGIIKRIVGLLCNAPVECHQHLVAWWARCPEQVLVLTKELVSGFLAYRLNRQNEKTAAAAAAEEEEAMRREEDTLGGLVPSMDVGMSSRAMLHAALFSQARPGNANGNAGGGGSGKKKKDEKPKRVIREDWQIKAAATVLGLVFAANKACHSREGLTAKDGRAGYLTGYLQQHHHARPQQHAISKPRAQVLPTSDFYITLLDETDVIADFETWSQRRGNTSHNSSLNHGSAITNTNARFTFCQHPYLLSIGAKMRILEHDARRQMETRARDAFFDSLLSDHHHHHHPREMFDRFLTLRVRRECLVEDSLSAVGEAIGASAAAGGGVGMLDVKKELRIEFMGEEGVDAGGLRKEWFLLLCRELFDPGNGMPSHPLFHIAPACVADPVIQACSSTTQTRTTAISTPSHSSPRSSTSSSASSWAWQSTIPPSSTSPSRPSPSASCSLPLPPIFTPQP